MKDWKLADTRLKKPAGFTWFSAIPPVALMALGRCSSGRNLAHIIGTNVRESRNDVSIAKPTAIVSGAKRNPPIPGIIVSGAKTITVVQVATITGTMTSAHPSSAARMRDLPR